MMTNTMMCGSLVSMVTAQALAWCLTECFSYNSNWEKTPSHSGKKHFFTKKYKLPVAGIDHLVEVCHIHRANKQFFGIGRFKPSQPFMTSSGTSKCTKTQQFSYSFAHLWGNVANDSSDHKKNVNELTAVTWATDMGQNICMLYRVPHHHFCSERSV